ncbi:MAG TPA: PucR family transcriptional regulator ligand-binding domain-containing protein [Nocardioidaceae bacterium]|nr:PucR family transcriptional regulator ligand-binding domain-containing protein [Nocardioidaceae bacterium]
MPFTVQNLLDLPLLEPARPEVVVGEDLDRRVVRWVHTSEIYEISPLLKGGEVLLTTGLGLVGMSGEAMSAYVRALARQGVAALVLELGRTFTRAPAELRDVATEHNLPLILLHGVVPFIEITETVHPLLIATEIEHLRRFDRASGELNRTLLAGLGVKELMETVREICQAPAGLYSLDDHLLAGDDVGVDPRTGILEVEVGLGPWAMLAVQAEDTPDARRLVEMGATSLGICLSQTSQASPTRRMAGADLLRDIASGRYLSSSELTSRASTIGFAVRSGSQAVGIAVDMTTMTSVRSGLTATTEAARKIFGPSLVAEIDGEVLVATALRPNQLRAKLAEFADAIDAELRATVGGSLVRLTAGPLVDDVAGLARSVPSAREAAQLAGKLTLGSRIVLASDLGVYHLLSNVVADAALERFIEEQLGPLLEQDARQGSDLALTLDAYLEAGLSKTYAAAALGIRRQTLYNRLERIARLLGGLDFDDRQHRTALDLALVSWRMRSSAATHRSGPSPYHTHPQSSPRTGTPHN